MRVQDWHAVADRYIIAAGGDPRFVLRSMDTELEKVAVLGTVARGMGWLAGRASAGGGWRGAVRSAGRWIGEGSVGGSAGVFGSALRGATVMAPMGAALGSVLPGPGTAVGAMLGGTVGAGMFGAAKAAERAVGYVKTLPGVFRQARSASFGATAAGKAQAEAVKNTDDVLGLLRRPGATRPQGVYTPAKEGSLFATPGGDVIEGAGAKASTVSTRPRAPASLPGTVAGDAAADPTAVPGLGQQFSDWWANPATPAWQRYGLIAGGAAIPAAGLGLMAGGGNTTVIQR